jgi:HAD superfamily phosphatase (TIGR01668 family)
MSNFRAGSFQRHLVFGPVRPFCPSHAVHRLQDVDPAGLCNRGIKLVLIDVDNTLVRWRTEDFAQETLDWIQKAKSHDIQICILSNTRNPARLDRLAKVLDIPALRGKFKPSTAMYRQALEKFGMKENQTVMIGDQIFTDILGANRAGIEAIWLQPISPHDFVGTKVSRFGEKLLKGYIYGLLTEPVDAPEIPAIESEKPFFERKIVHQLLKFLIVGGSSFVIDYCIRMTLLYAGFCAPTTRQAGLWLMQNVPGFNRFHAPEKAFFPIASLCSGSVAILNSFYWNRRWTFSIRGTEERTRQFHRFVIVSVIGILLNTLISTSIIHVLPGNSKSVARVGILVAAMIVAVWNFSLQRIWAFKNASVDEK